MAYSVEALDDINAPYPPFRHSDSHTIEDDIYHIWDKKESNTLIKDKDGCAMKLVELPWTIITNQYITASPTAKQQQYIEIKQQLQKILAPALGYIVISQHDDLMPEVYKNMMPAHTIFFSAGGNRRESNIIPIPLIYNSPEVDVLSTVNMMTEKEWQKLKLAVFIGSNTNPIRQRMCEYLFNQSDIICSLKTWSPLISSSEQQQYIKGLHAARFIIAPSGYGPTSFRFYEALRANRIPVYVFDDKGPFLPFTDFITWNKCAIILHHSQIVKLPSLLRTISYSQYTEMIQYYWTSVHQYMSISYIRQYILQIVSQQISWQPEIVACIATAPVTAELQLMLTSLQLFNLVAPTIFLICDSAIATAVHKMGYHGEINTRVELEQYVDYTRKEMESRDIIIDYDIEKRALCTTAEAKAHIPLPLLTTDGMDKKKQKQQYTIKLWTQFMFWKMRVVAWAASSQTAAGRGVFFSDTDICHTAKLPHIPSPSGIDFMIIPHGITAANAAAFGKYNSGFMWFSSVSTPAILLDWYDATLISEYFEQKALEMIATKYRTWYGSSNSSRGSEVAHGSSNSSRGGEVAHGGSSSMDNMSVINYGWWRMYESDKTPLFQQKQWTLSYPGWLNSGIHVSGDILASVHTHFDENANADSILAITQQFNKWMIEVLCSYPYYPNNVLLGAISKIVNKIRV